MSAPTIREAGVATYEIEIQIDVPPQKVWDAIIQNINAWWLPDFHMVGQTSKITIEPRAGGQIIEATNDGASLLWATVELIQPSEHALYLASRIAPDWGGPATSHLKIKVEPRDNASTLKVTDAHYGHIDPKNLQCLKDGWTTLFTDGLKEFAENGTRHDQ